MGLTGVFEHQALLSRTRRVQGHWDRPGSLQQRTCPNSARTLVLPLSTPRLGDHGRPALPEGPQEGESGEKLPPARAEPPGPQSLPKGKPWAFTHWTLGALGAEASCAWGREVAEEKETPCLLLRASLVAQTLKNLPAMQETWVQSPGWEDPLEKDMATHSSILPGEFYGQRSLVGYSPGGPKELDTTEGT